MIQGKRILLTTESLGPVNGVSRTTRSLIEYLQTQGADIVVVSPCSPASPASPGTPEQAPLLREPPKPESYTLGTPTKGIKEIRIQGYPLPYNPDLTVVYPIHLHDLYRRAFPQTGRPDLVYVASPASLGFQVLLQVRQTRNPPPVLVNFQTDLSAYARILLPSPLAPFAVWLLDSVQGYLFRHHSVRTIFYPSSAIETYLVNGTHTPRDRLQRLGRGVDTTLFNPSRRDESYRASIAPNGELILLCVCRLAPEKGFEFLAQAVRSLLSRNQIPRGIKLLLVGGNRNPVVQNHIHGLFASSSSSSPPLQDAVIFTGFLGGEDLARAYAIADVFVHCSVTETFGLVVLESMASGVPVVARAQGGPVDIIQHGRTGYLVSSEEGGDEVDRFVAMVERVLCDQEGREQLGRQAREYALATTWDAINGRVATYLSSLSEAEDAGEPPRHHHHHLSGMSVVKLVGAAMEAVRLRVAVAMVYAMWMIAVVPLLVHGFFLS